MKNFTYSIVFMLSVTIGSHLQAQVCDPVSSFSENFDSATVPALPNCWSKIIRGEALEIDEIKTSANIVNSGPNALSMFKGFTGDKDIILVSPEVLNLEAGTNKLSFYAVTGTPGAQLEIGTLNSNGDTGIFTPFKTVDVVNTDPVTQYTVDFSGYNTTDNYIGIRIKNVDTQFISFYLDTIVWDTALSTSDFNTSKITYYPNPVKNVLNLSSVKDISAITVYNLLGQKVMTRFVSTNQAQIDMSALADGSYIVKLTANNQQNTIRIIKD